MFFIASRRGFPASGCKADGLRKDNISLPFQYIKFAGICQSFLSKRRDIFFHLPFATVAGEQFGLAWRKQSIVSKSWTVKKNGQLDGTAFLIFHHIRTKNSITCCKFYNWYRCVTYCRRTFGSGAGVQSFQTVEKCRDFWYTIKCRNRRRQMRPSRRQYEEKQFGRGQVRLCSAQGG